MKILIIINSLSSGGAERQAVQDANILFASGYEICFCFGVTGPLELNLSQGIQIINFGTKSELLASILLYRFMRENKIDLVFSHMFWANKVATFVCYLSNVKLITFEHGLGLWRKWYHLLMVKMIGKVALNIITCSHASKKIRVENEALPVNKLFVIPNSYKAPIETGDNAIILAEKSKRSFYIGFSGRFNKVKQLGLLVQLAMLLRKSTDDFQFVLLGDGVEKIEIEQLVNQNGLTEIFNFLGYVTNPIAYLKLMDCFVLPSKREDFSLALLEASYAQLPCVAFDVGGNSEIIENGVTGYIIEPYDIQKMSLKLLDLIMNPELARDMGKKAKAKVENNFSENQRIENLIWLINQI